MQLALALLALAPVQNGALPLPAPLRHAGTYDVATNTLTPGGSLASNAFVVRYSNTASPTVYVPTVGPTGSIAGGVLSDTGRIGGDFGPPTDSPPGYDSNRIDAFRFAYCDLDPTPGAAGLELAFFDRLAPCGSPESGAVRTIELTGLPTGGCWTVEVELRGSETFCLAADGGDLEFDGDLALDSFGWSVRYTGSGTSAAGVVLAGDPSATDGFAYSNPNTPGAANPPAPPSQLGVATFFNPFGSGCTDGARLLGSGNRTPDGFRVDPPGFTGPATCVDGAYVNSTGSCGAAEFPFSGLYLELDARWPCGPACGCTFCGYVPCVSTFNSTGRIGSVGLEGSNVAADDDFTLRGASLPPGQFGIFLHGTQFLSAPIQLGDQFLCIEQSGRFDGPGQILQVNPAGEVELSTSTGLLDLDALPIAAAPFSVAASVGTTSYFGFWHRDATALGFAFTRPCSVLWQ
ncbi:MAG: hypothetical protein AAFZ87_14455 [Planctomycetota bacterium]